MILLRDFHLSRHAAIPIRAPPFCTIIYIRSTGLIVNRDGQSAQRSIDFRRREDSEYFHSLKQSFRWFHESREISWEKFCAIFDVNILRIIERKELERKFCSKGKGSVGRRMKI